MVENIILYTKEDTVKKVLEVTNGVGVGVDAVFDGARKGTCASPYEVIM